MNRDEIIKLVDKCLVEEFEIEADLLVDDAHLVQDLGLDSLDFVDMVVVIQKTFNVELREDPRVREVRTVGDLHELVVQLNDEIGDKGKES